MLLNSRQFKFLKNYRNVYVKSNAKRGYRNENVFLKGDRALSKLITLLISNKKKFNHFFKSRRTSDILLKLGNIHQNGSKQIFTFSSEKVLDLCKMGHPPPVFVKCPRFETPWTRKNGFYECVCLSVCLCVDF